MLTYTLGLCMDQNKPLAFWDTNKDLRIFEPSPRGKHVNFLAQKYDYWGTEYPQKDDIIDPRRFADLENMPYSNEFFNFVLTSDVFEHVRLYEKVLAEIFRVLKPNGYFLLQYHTSTLGMKLLRE